MRRLINILGAVLLALVPVAPLRAADPRMPPHGTCSDSYAPAWTGAFVTGNGNQGAMVMGCGSTPPRPNEDTIYFSHAGLYLPVGTKTLVPDLAKGLPEMRGTIKTKGYGPALMTTFAAAQKQNFPGLTYTDPFIPALELKLKLPSAGGTRDYLRTENFQNGEVCTHWSDDRGSFVRRLFISRAQNVAALWIGPDAATGAKATVSCEISIPPIPNIPVRTFLQNNPGANPADGAANALIHATTELDSSGITLRATYREGGGRGYDAAARIVATGGTSRAADGAFSVKDARGILVLLRVQPFDKVTADSDDRLRRSLDDIAPDYEALLEAHRRIHQPLFDRVALDLGGGEDRGLTTDALIERANKEGKASPALLERLYEGARYAHLCSAGTAPGTVCSPNLQGVWAGQWAPSFTLAGDYSFNISYQLAVASALSCRTPELLEGTFRLADQSVSDWQVNARNLFGTRGIVVPAHQSSSGLNVQWSDRNSGSLLWTAGAGVLAHWYFDYYLHTGDREFLANRAVPYMKQAAAFYEDFLFVDGTGKYRFSPSYSPDDAAGDNATMDIMVAKELLTNLITACRLLEIDAAGVARWQKMLELMPPYQIAENGELQEWALPGVANKLLHRHIPHLYAVYQSGEFDAERTPVYWEASRAAFEKRLAVWFTPPTRAGDANPQPIHDRVIMGLCAARFGMGEKVEAILARLAARNTYPSMMTQRYEDSHTLVSDGNAIPEILNSSLACSRPGRIDLLPALPPSLASGEIRGLAARSLTAPITITRLAWTPREVQVELMSAAEQTVELRAPGGQVRSVMLPARVATRAAFQLPG